MKYTKTSSEMSSTLLTMLKNGCHGFSILFVFYGFFTARKGWFFACGGFLPKKLLNVTSLHFHWRVYRHTLLKMSHLEKRLHQ